MDRATFQTALWDRPSDPVVRNPYDAHSCRRNLELYLEFSLRRPVDALLVGEAPGYRGCGVTGIPFTSPSILASCLHDFFIEARPELSFVGTRKEASAAAVWAVLESSKQNVLIWNAFPFHPHHPGEPDTNRAPTAAERSEGAAYLDMLISLAAPLVVIAVGRAAAKTLATIDLVIPSVEVRHPSFGGTRIFREQLAALLLRMNEAADDT